MTKAFHICWHVQTVYQVPTSGFADHNSGEKLVAYLDERIAGLDAEPNELEFILRSWHDRALPVIRTKPFKETQIDFLKAWP